MNKLFPRTEIEGVSMPRMIIGTNWFLGYSHKTATLDNYLKEIHDEHTIAKTLEAYLEYGIDAITFVVTRYPIVHNAIKIAEDKTGKGITIIDTPFFDVSNTTQARQEAEREIKKSASLGTRFCLPHHTVVERLVRKDSETIERLPDYLQMIRDAGMIPGVSAHMPELIIYSDKNEYDVQVYIQIYNCIGFLMQVEVELVNNIIWNAKKPVMTIKSMAAGRITPFVGITFNYNTLRPCDMVTVGAVSPGEVHEDVEIALAAIEHRHPDTEGRGSVANSSVVKKKV